MTSCVVVFDGRETGVVYDDTRKYSSCSDPA